MLAPHILGPITHFLLSFKVIWIQKNGNNTLKEESLMEEQRNFCKERNSGNICVHQEWEQGRVWGVYHFNLERNCFITPEPFLTLRCEFALVHKFSKGIINPVHEHLNQF